MSLAALTGEEVNAFRLEVARRMRTDTRWHGAFRLEVARRMRTERWNDSIPWSREAANKVIMVSSLTTVDQSVDQSIYLFIYLTSYFIYSG